MSIYLDNSATTQVAPEVAEAMQKVFTENFGNPSSMHRLGYEAEQQMKDAISKLARTLHCKDSELIFTSGGTESDNMAIFGTAKAKLRQGKHMITTCFEHPAVLNPMIELEKQGYEITFLPVDKHGLVSAEQVRKALRPDTVLVSIMMVNNEIGAREPVEEIGTMLKKQAPNVYFHVDAVQGFGKYQIRPDKCGIDMMSVSGHKLHGPKGIGFLYIRDGVRISPLLYGGGQQKDMRPGTENVPGIVGISKAAELVYEDFDSKREKMIEFRDHLAKELSKLDDVIINGPSGEDESCCKGGAHCGGDARYKDGAHCENSAPHIVSASFKDIRSEVLLHALEEKGIYVSSGSACASNHPGISGTLKAIGVPDEYISGTIRFSMSSYTTLEEIDKTIEAVRELLPKLRRFVRK